MGFTPREVEDMSIWQFTAVTVGWGKQFEESGMSDKEADDLFAWLQSQDDVPLSFTTH